MVAVRAAEAVEAVAPSREEMAEARARAAAVMAAMVAAVVVVVHRSQ